MTRDEWQRVKQVASAALDESEAARPAFVASACGADTALRDEVLSLLDATQAAANRYETPALAIHGAAAAIHAGTAPSWTDTVGLRIGPYVIDREVGKGGMGRVFLAHRVDGEFEQQVAVKFVGDGALAGAALTERFRQERRILAMLEHPNIARLVDGGTTADGRPYVVMEYVSGEPIDDYAESRRLDLRSRIDLVRSACAAVQYAHQHLVIHRDIKANNILVTADGTVKLLDFGIATLVDPDTAPDARPLTLLRAMTFETASPEQLQGRPITIAADVYGLGLLLYRLLTRQSPYRPAAGTDAALLRAICDDPPTPPTVALMQAPTGAPLEKVPHDLELIVLKALRKEPERRYGTAAELSDDLERYLDDRPVLAAPDSPRYRVAKFVRRHWAATAASAVAVAALAGAAGVAVYQARVASVARADAQRRFEDVRRVANSFLFEFHDAIADLPGALAARQLVVRRAAEYLDGLATDAHGDRGLERELANAYLKLAGILGGGGVSNLGDLDGALAHYRKAQALLDGLAASPQATAADFDEQAYVRILLSRFFVLKGDLELAAVHAAEAVALLDAPRPVPAAAGRDGRLATAHHQLGYVLTLRGEAPAALASLGRAISHATRDAIDRPDDEMSASRLARIAPDYAAAMIEAGQAPAALRMVAGARQQLADLMARSPQNSRYQRDLAFLQSVESDALEAAGDRAGAISALVAATTSLEQLLAREPTDQGTHVGAMLSHCALGRLLLKDKQRDPALTRLRECIADGAAITRASPTHHFARAQLGTARIELGDALVASDQSSSEGCRELRAGLDDLSRVAADAPQLVDPRGYAGFERRWKTCRAPASGRAAQPTGGRSGR